MSEDAKLLAAARKPGRPKGKCLGGYVEVDAPADVIWSIAGDWKNWPSWNPLYTQTAGEPREGSQIDMTVKLRDMKPFVTRATVYAYRPNELFEYGLSQMGGMTKAMRFVEIEEIAPGRCGVANCEIMGGPLGWILGRTVGPKVTEGLKAMNAKLKELAEAKAREKAAS